MNNYRNDAYLISLENEIKELAFNLAKCKYHFITNRSKALKTQIFYMEGYLNTLIGIYQHEKSKEPETR